MNAIVHIITHRISVPLLVAGLLVSGLAAETRQCPGAASLHRLCSK